MFKTSTIRVTNISQSTIVTFPTLSQCVMYERMLHRSVFLSSVVDQSFARVCQVQLRLCVKTILSADPIQEQFSIDI